LLRTQETYFEKIAVKAQGTQTGIKTSISLFFSYCMEKGIGDPLLLMKKSEENCFTYCSNTGYSWNKKN